MTEEPDWMQFNGRTIESVEPNDFQELEIRFTDGSMVTLAIGEAYGDYSVVWGDQ